MFLDPAEAALPNAATIAWLTAKGISGRAIGLPWPVHTGKAIFPERGTYVPNRLGEGVLIFAVIECGGEIIDLAAWAPRTSKIGTRLGIGGCLGQGQIGRDGMGTHGPALPVWRTPIGWLQHDRVGIVIVDPLPAAHALAGKVLQAEDDVHAAELGKVLQVPAPIILASVAERRAA